MKISSQLVADRLQRVAEPCAMADRYAACLLSQSSQETLFELHEVERERAKHQMTSL